MSANPNLFSRMFSRLFGSRNDRVLKRMHKQVERINAMEEGLKVLDDIQLRGKTEEFKQRIEQGESLDQLLPEAFAVVREAGRRVHNMRHFDAQLIGGMVLHEGNIAEMKTGEGKTLVATLPSYLHALGGRGVHVVTVNDYLARRDAEWMGKIHQFLGLTVGSILGGMSPQQRREAYACDITYGTNNEFGFDYLRDNMAFVREDRVQRELNFAVVDEVDSILIDEARTPLIISGPSEDRADIYQQVNKLVPNLKQQEEEEGPGDYSVDEKAKQVYLTEAGHEHIEALLTNAGLLQEGDSLYSASNITLMHHVYAAIRAHVLFHRDVEYVVQNNEIVIVDEFTGRTMPGRRWSEGLHQAVEAKEGVAIQNENQTLASITFQNYFRLYEVLSGMTGTADTEAFEFQQIYSLEVVVVPTNKPMVRDDLGDLVYLTQKEKYAAIIEDISECQQRQQPALVGTTSIEVSEYLSGLLNKAGIKHQVLNAKFHEKEAQIVAEAGRPGAVTIATNMAGRGTDIILGGNPESERAALEEDDELGQRRITDEWQKRHQDVLDAGGLHIIGTERHESRRIDNQLRGRAGRQGDPGSTRFYLSLEDNLMRIFASERVSGLMQKLGMEEGEAIEHPWVTRAIENAQRKVEGRNFDIRKNLLEFDDVANDQRRVIYEQRRDLMEAADISENIAGIRDDVVNRVIDQYIAPQSMDELWDISGLEEALQGEFAATLPVQQWLDQDEDLHEDSLRRKIIESLEEIYQQKEHQVGAETMRRFEQQVMLSVLDSHWKEHLAAMDHLRQGIGLRGYAQKNPKQEYKREAFEMFTELLENIKQEVIGLLCKVQVRGEEDVEAVEQQHRQTTPMEYNHAEATAMGQAEAPAPAAASAAAQTPAQQPFKRQQRKIGRNDPCPCGSGKKYKQCCGKLT